ncbi:uncharacterized protein [Mytilus edulis]|uniref:uncharacterized protein n=1 Tax=Mytilus edulis TaxID=6550 RepID=UPI0039F10FD1
MKQRILSYPKIPTLSNSNRKNHPTANEVGETKEVYDKYGHVLPASVTGSKGFWKKKWLDLVAMVRKLGPADLFVTLTANDGWDPLKSILSKYSKPQSILHPVDTTEYFFKRFEGIKPLLFGTNSVFGDVADHWYRIEAQNRGALHVHCLIWLKEGSNKDNLVSAQVPTTTDDFSNELAQKVKDYQIHNCRPNRCFRTKKGLATNQCKYGFPYSLRDDDGYAADNLRYEYKRLNPQDSRVVPYNPYILYVWDAHINVQHVTRSGLEKYLVKYVAKVEPTFGLTVKDNPVSSYFETRIVGAPEAAAAVMSHHFVSSTRQVLFIDTNLKSERSRVLKPYEQLQASDGDGTDIFIKGPRDFYEERPSNDICSNLTLVEYLSDFEIFTTRSKIPKNRQSTIYTDVQGRYVVQRIKSLIPRYRFLTPLDSEAFYFQTLLLNVSYRSENELLSQENTSQTYKEECYLRSLFDSSDALDIVFSEMTDRNFDPLQIAKMARRLLIEQISDEATLSRKIRGLELGVDVDLSDDILPQYNFIQHDITGDLHSTEVLKLLHWSKEAILKDKTSLVQRKNQMSSSQKKVFDCIMSGTDTQTLAFITGPGGCGKSFLLHTLVLQFEFSGLIVEVLGTTGNAALLINGRTVHSFFKLDPELNTSIGYNDNTWQAISLTDIIIIDEISMMTAEILEKISQICTQTCQNSKQNQHFGGKTVILFGDLLQLPAVTNNCSKTRQIYESVLWSEFLPLFLYENCRQAEDQEYCQLLNRLRVGEQNLEDIKMLESRICGEGHPTSKDCNNSTSSSSMVICSKHSLRNEINDMMQTRLLQSSKVYHLHARDCDLAGNEVSFQDTQVINNVKSVLPKTITIHEGAKVMITRNLNIQDHVVNGTVGYLKSVHKNVVMVQRLDSDELIPVSKVKQKVIIPFTKTPVYRIQYPLIVAYACTVHRMQGATLDSAFIHLDDSFFAPGQAYVALSRVKSLQGLHIIKFSTAAFKTNNEVCKMLWSAEKNGSLYVVSSTDSSSNKTMLNEQACSNSSKLPQLEKSSCKKTISLNPSNMSNLSADNIVTTSTALSRRITVQLCRNISELQKSLTTHEFLLDQLADSLQQLTAVANPNLRVSGNVRRECHPTFLEHFVPIQTPPRGNCLWDMISISLCQQPKYMQALRILTVYTIIKHQNIFKSFLQSDNALSTLSIDEQYQQLILTARTPKQWGNEYHLYALCIILKRPIYIYSTFKVQEKFSHFRCTAEHLRNLFSSNSFEIGRHLKYVPDSKVVPSNTLGQPLCGFFKSSHYTAVLPRTDYPPNFVPQCSILPR